MTKFTEFLSGELLRVLRFRTLSNGETLEVESLGVNSPVRLKRGDLLIYMGSYHSKWGTTDNPEVFHYVLCHGYLGTIYANGVMLTREL